MYTGGLLGLLRRPPRGAIFLLMSRTPSVVLPAVLDHARHVGIQGVSRTDVSQVLRSGCDVRPTSDLSVTRLTGNGFVGTLRAVRLGRRGRRFFSLFIDLVQLSCRQGVERVGV